MTPNKQLSTTRLFFFRIKLIHALLFCLLCYQPVSATEQWHSHDDIQSTAVEFVRAQIPDDISINSLTANNIDSRLKLKQCSEPLEASATMNRQISQNWTINVRCNDTSAWNLYIPVKAYLTRKMVVSKTTITRGELITADKVQLMEQPITAQNNKHFTDTANVIGREARKTIKAGRVFDTTMLQQAYLVRKKESVLIYAQNQKLRISMQGTALTNGRYNEMINVRNNSSKKVIEALVVDRGVVAINF